VQPNEITEVLNRPISQELLARDVTRLAYVAKDGTPRTVPIIFTWNGSELVMCTPKNAPKLRALSENPMVALTIDTEVHPPKILLIRGRAELDFVDGIPDEYLQATSTYEMTPEQRVEWEAEVRSLYYNGMVRIVVTPPLGEADRFRDDSAERGRGAGPAAGGAAARLDPRVNMAHNRGPTAPRETPKPPGQRPASTNATTHAPGRTAQRALRG
jgi:hypothetical protein